MRNIFTKHPHSIGETYFQHFKFAVVKGIQMFFVSLALIIHAFLPFLFTFTASNFVKRINKILEERATKQ